MSPYSRDLKTLRIHAATNFINYFVEYWLRDFMDDNPFEKMNLSNAEFITAIAHYYRGEVGRMNTWRQRLDVTTNWAIVATAAFLSFGFSNREAPHFVIILATIFVLFFLIIEARRYKYYDLWRWRVALINENFFAIVFSPRKKPLLKNWRELLSNELQHSRFKMSFAEAFGRRLRRNYSWIFIVLGLCWVIKISIHPMPVESMNDFINRAAIFHLVSGWVVIATGIVFNGLLLLIALGTMKKRKEEVRIYPAKKSRIKLQNL